MPRQPTKGTTAVNIELPTELVERVRDFAQRDMRSVKAEFIRALQLLLDTYATTSASRPQGANFPTELPSTDRHVGTWAGTRPPMKGKGISSSLAKSGPKPVSPLAQMQTDAFDRLLDALPEDGKVRFIARCRRGGFTAEEIVKMDSKLKSNYVKLQIKNLEEMAEGDIKT